MSCTIHYIKDTAFAHCMNCKLGWDREFMDNNFTKVFVNGDYKVHRQNMLFDRERSMLPETQNIIELIIKMKKIYATTKDRLDVVKLELYAVEMKSATLKAVRPLDRVWNIVESIKYDDTIIEYGKKIAELTYEKKILDIRCTELKLYIEKPENITKPKETKERSQFVHACPAENCKGFLSTQWKCGLCKVNVCSTCQEIKLINHVCNEDTVKTVALMKKDSRACPTCAAVIFKINGCNQIWCTQCHTAFDFKSGLIEKNIHNPHYYEWMRQTGQQIPRAIGDGNCELLDVFTLIQNASSKIGRNQETYRIIYKLEETDRFRRHIEQVELPRYRVNADANLDLRVKYMMNEITETHFKETIQIREKKNEKNREYTQVITMYLTVCRDILIRVRDVSTLLDAEALVGELGKLCEYFNQCMETISKRYKCVSPKIDYKDGTYKFRIKAISKKKTDVEERLPDVTYL
jgi:ribosomal protein L32